MGPAGVTGSTKGVLVSGDSKVDGGAWMRRTVGRMALAGALVGVVLLVSAASEAALSGAPIKVGTPFESGPPSVAVDPSGTAFVAWANTKDLGGSLDTVQYCVIPVGATGCSHSGTLKPADSASPIDGVQVLIDGSTVVLLADVFGAAGPSAQDFVPEQEWTSTDGGATSASSTRVSR
jgi:hypothetical protein